MTDTAVQFLARPIHSQQGQPLRVAAYSRIAEAIRMEILRPGSLLPTETELGTMMDVSRTVIREALMLLEEDGLTRSRRGVGRFVADTLPRIGIEHIRPFDQLLRRTDCDIRVKRVAAARVPASEFVAPGIGAQPGDECWFWESVLLRDGEPVAHLQENVAADIPEAGDVTRVAEALALPATTLLEILAKNSAAPFDTSECEISLSTAGPSRAKLLDLRPSEPVLVLTQYVRRAGSPLYLAKCLISAKAGHLSVIQSS